MDALISCDPFPICDRLRAAHATIREEVDQAPDDLWVTWPNQVDVSGNVRLIPLFLRYRPPTLPAVEERAREACPRTWELLRNDTQTIVISRMQPDCHVRPHRDLDGPDHLRCHLGLTVREGAWMRVDGQLQHWRDGECIVFDPRRTHEVKNESDVPRTILIVDFLPTAAQLAAAGCDGLQPNV